jgi:hypothetical protein
MSTSTEIVYSVYRVYRNTNKSYVGFEKGGVVSAKVVARNEREARRLSIPHCEVGPTLVSQTKASGVSVMLLGPASHKEYNDFLIGTLEMWPMLRPHYKKLSETLGLDIPFLPHPVVRY